MKIYRLHVENFGILSDISMDFSDGCNRIMKENGWGKSTLAAFIRVMFYGLEGGRKKGISSNDRARFAPWEGGTFGGEIEFEAGGKRYILNRTFGKKEADAEFSLRDAGTMLPSGDYTENIGEEIFGIDSESFRKTSFIDHDGIKYAGSNSIISSRVTPLSQTDDLNNYDLADKKMNDFLNANSEKKRTGRLWAMKNELQETKRELKKKNALQSAMEDNKNAKEKENAETKRLQNERKELLEKHRNLSENRAKAVNFAHFKQLEKEIKSREDNVAGIRAQFGERIPGLSDLQEFSEKNQKAENCRILLKRANVSDEGERFERLKRYFKDNPPTEEEIKEKIDSCNHMKSLLKENASLEEQISSEKSRLGASEDELATGKRNLATKSEDFLKLKAGKADNAEIPKAEEIAETTQAVKKTSPAFLTVAVILLMAGLVCVILFFVLVKQLLLPIAGIVLMILGLVLLILGTMRSRKEKKLATQALAAERKAAKERERLAEEKQRLALEKQEKVLKAENEIKLLESEISALEKQIDSVKDYLKSSNEKTEENTEKIKADEAILKAFLERFEIPYSRSDAEDTLYEMKGRLQEFQSLSKENEDRKEQIALLMKQSEEADAELKEIMQRLSVFEAEELDYEKNRSLVQKLNVMLSELEGAGKELGSAQAKKRAFLAQHPEFACVNEDGGEAKPADVEVLTEEEIEEKSAIIEEKTGEIDETMKKKAELISLYNRNIESISAELDELRSKEEAYEDQSTEYEALSEKYRLVEKTREYLRKSKERFIAKYMQPIKSSFDSYMEIMARHGFSGGDEFLIDANLEIKRKESGNYHDVESQSDGFSDMIGICIRMALLDVMYQNEKPMVIMDDPFTNLDGRNLAGAMEFLKKAEEKYQILYFTCHEDRI